MSKGSVFIQPNPIWKSEGVYEIILSVLLLYFFWFVASVKKKNNNHLNHVFNEEVRVIACRMSSFRVIAENSQLESSLLEWKRMGLGPHLRTDPEKYLSLLRSWKPNWTRRDDVNAFFQKGTWDGNEVIIKRKLSSIMLQYHMVNASQFIFILSQIERIFLFSVTGDVFWDTKKFCMCFLNMCSSISADFSRPVCVVNWLYPLGIWRPKFLSLY